VTGVAAAHQDLSHLELSFLGFKRAPTTPSCKNRSRPFKETDVTGVAAAHQDLSHLELPLLGCRRAYDAFVQKTKANLSEKLM